MYRATWRGRPSRPSVSGDGGNCVEIKLAGHASAADVDSTQAGNSEDEALAMKDFHNEATVLFRLRHPNIATLLAYSDARERGDASELMRGSVDRLGCWRRPLPTKTEGSEMGYRTMSGHGVPPLAKAAGSTQGPKTRQSTPGLQRLHKDHGLWTRDDPSRVHRIEEPGARLSGRFDRYYR